MWFKCKVCVVEAFKIADENIFIAYSYSEGEFALSYINFP
jgi:hypothetical protein